MALRDVLLVILAVMLLTLLPAMISGSQTLHPQSGRRSTLAAGVILLLLLASLFARSKGFGVDTLTYADLLGGYCQGHSTDELDLSYRASLLLLNVGMLGACKVSWLPAAWALMVSALLLCLPVPWPFRLRYAALLLFSLIGIELTTNALRQGLSMAVFMLSVALWTRHQMAALLVAVAAVILHTSTAMVLMGLVLSTLPWRWFWLGLLAAIGAVMIFIQYNLEPMLLQPLLYEIQKYMAHDADEVWIRVLAFSSVVAALLVPLFSAVRGRRYTLLSNRAYAIAMRVGFCCVPFLYFPYFGYRIIYGFYPLLLYFTLLNGPREGVRVDRHFALLLGFNALLLLVWAQGSTYMRDVPFLE